MAIEIETTIINVTLSTESGDIEVTVPQTFSGGSGEVEEAPIDGNEYVRQDAAWVQNSGGVGLNDTDDLPEGLSNLYYTEARVSLNSNVVANSAKTGITAQQAADITTNNAKNGISAQQESDITTNNAKVGITPLQASDILDNNTKVSYDAAAQAEVAANTAKVSYPSGDASKLAGIESGATQDQTGAEIKIAYETEANTNGFTDALKAKLDSIDAAHYGSPVQDESALSALTESSLTDKERRYVEDSISDYFYDAQAVSGDIAPDDQTGGTGFWKQVAVGGDTPSSIKTKYESNADTNAFTDSYKNQVDTNTAKTGITAQQTSDITANNAKVTYDDAAAVAANTAKRSFPIADENKLDGIATGATANDTDANLKNRANHTGTQVVATISDFDTEVAGNSAVTANTAKRTYPALDETKLGNYDTEAIVVLTQSAYDALTPDADTLYIING